ncbi:formyl transferase [Rhizobium sp. ARZ01]|nr:formyl transferase [Rhizobium sp. ARZ01]
MTVDKQQPASAGATNTRVVVVTQGGPNPEILVNALRHHFSDLIVIEELPESKGQMLRQKARRLGWSVAVGQIATMAVSKFGKPFVRKRAQAIIEEFRVNTRPDPSLRRFKIDNANGPEFERHIAELKPAVVFLVSCRLLKRSTLEAIPCPVLNFHAGINPAYRGQQGGYWSRVMRDEENFGATVHLVDAGVDTGDVLYQVRVTPSKRDTMHTYPLLLTAAGTGIAVRAVGAALSGEVYPQEMTSMKSRQWYHPTIWTWVWNGISHGIW